MKYIAIALALALSGCANASPPPAASNPGAGAAVQICQAPPGSVCLTMQELNVLGPIVGGRYQALQQEAQALGTVIQDIQRQTAQKPPEPPKK